MSQDTTMKEIPSNIKTRTRAKKRNKFKRHLPVFMMMAPGLIYLFINNYIPMFGLVIAFKDINYSVGIWASEWVGFDNFKYLFATQDAYIITRNTILYNGAFIIINTVVAVTVAIMLNEVRAKFAKGFYQSAILLPFLISMVIVSYLAYAFLSTDVGFLNNKILPMLGLDEISWYMESHVWPYILTLVNMWKEIGFSAIIFLAAIAGIDHELYEAATLDGANKWHQIRHITVPLIMPIIILLTLLAVGKIFYSDFGLFYQVPMNSGAIYDTTNVIDTYVYRGLMELGDIGMAAAAGMYQSVVGFILVLFSNWLVRMKDKDSALF